MTKTSLAKLILLLVCVAGGAWLGAHFFGNISSATISIVNKIHGQTVDEAGNPVPDQPKLADDPEYQLPEDDKNRLDILLLGIRGKDDVQNGGLLTDTILLFSLDKTTGKSTLVSIPRDLTVRVSDTKTEKINTAYILNGLGGAKKLFSRVTGVGIDNVVVFDFEAFKDVVNTLGGITVTLEKPFVEKEQWGYEFNLPAGDNALNGDQALYYVRSRYGSSDFDRSRRQMQVILATKKKISQLSLTSDPLKILQIVQAVRKHVDTDLNILDLGTLKNLAQQGDSLGKIKLYQLTTENVLYETKVDGIYELLPRDNTLAPLKKFFQTVLTDNPVLPTPTPTPTP